jgi:hypothetical protein
MATPSPENIADLKRELYRRSNDQLRVHNPLDVPFQVTYDGFVHVIPAKSDHILPRYIATVYFSRILDHLINSEEQHAVEVENQKRLKKGLKLMDPQEREAFDVSNKLTTNNPDKRRSYMAQVYKGIEQEFGLDQVPSEADGKPAASKKPLDEELLEEMESKFSSQPPIQIDTEDYDDGEFSLEGIAASSKEIEDQ